MALENSRLFSVCHLLTAQNISEWQEILPYTELLNILHYIYGEGVINTLFSCIINKTRNVVFRNRKFPSGLRVATTTRCRSHGILKLRKSWNYALVSLNNSQCGEFYWFRSKCFIPNLCTFCALKMLEKAKNWAKNLVIQITRFIFFISIKLKSSHPIFERTTDITLNENPSCRIQVVSCRQTDGWAHKTKLAARFRYFAKPP